MKENLLKTKNNIFSFFKNYGRILFLCFALILFLLIIYFYQNFANPKKLIVRFLDVGQGDSILIEMPTHENILIDAGPSDTVVNKLEKHLPVFDKKIDLAIFSHPDADHITGFYYILQKYNVAKIIQNGDDNKETEVYKEVGNKIEKEIEKINAEKITVSCGDKITFGDSGENNLLIYILHPIKNELVINDTNDNSVVLLLTYGSYSFLFVGDAGKDVEQKLFFNIERCFTEKDKNTIESSLKNLTVLKASHHGSNTGSGEEFLKKIKLEYSVISAGEDNRYGHPAKETFEILNKYSKNVLSTIDNGDVSFLSNGKDFEVVLERVK